MDAAPPFPVPRPLPRRRRGAVFPPVLDAKDAATGLPPPAPLDGFAGEIFSSHGIFPGCLLIGILIRKNGG